MIRERGESEREKEGGSLKLCYGRMGTIKLGRRKMTTFRIFPSPLRTFRLLQLEFIL